MVAESNSVTTVGETIVVDGLEAGSRRSIPSTDSVHTTAQITLFGNLGNGALYRQGRK